MTEMIIILSIILYLLIGAWIYATAVNSFGGKAGYIEEIEEENPGVNGNLIYYFSGFLVTFFWPIFVIKGIINYRRNRHE